MWGEINTADANARAADHTRSVRADAALMRLRAGRRDVQPATDLEKSTLTASIANLDKLGQAGRSDCSPHRTMSAHRGRCGWSST